MLHLTRPASSNVDMDGTLVYAFVLCKNMQNHGRNNVRVDDILRDFRLALFYVHSSAIYSVPLQSYSHHVGNSDSYENTSTHVVFCWWHCLLFGKQAILTDLKRHGKDGIWSGMDRF